MKQPSTAAAVHVELAAGLASRRCALLPCNTPARRPMSVAALREDRCIDRWAKEALLQTAPAAERRRCDPAAASPPVSFHLPLLENSFPPHILTFVLPQATKTASSAMLAALQLAAPALAAAWAWSLATLSTLFWGTFWALRLGVYAVLVWTAWENIIEERGTHHANKVRVAQRPPALWHVPAMLRRRFSSCRHCHFVHSPLQHKTKAKHSGSGSPKLSAEILREHDAAAAAAAVPGGSAGRARRRPPRSPSTLSSESHDSIEDW